MVRKKDKAGRYVVERKQREDKVGKGGVRDPLRDAPGPQPIAASDQSPDRYHFPKCNAFFFCKLHAAGIPSPPLILAVAADVLRRWAAAARFTSKIEGR
jgi:hypothetical protein